MRKYAAYMVLGLAGLLGGGSLIAFMVFLFAGSLNLVSLGLDQSRVFLLDAALSLLFFMQHSGMIRKPFRRQLTRFIPEEYDGAVYAIASGIVLSLVIVFWQETGQAFIVLKGLSRWSFRAVFWLSLLGFLWGGVALKSFDPCGIRPILDSLRGMNPKRMPFVVRGPYRWIRHPLYLSMILMIWSCPDITTDRLLFNIPWTVWIVVGAFLEERDLITEFGETYREYQMKVPMLIPRRIHPSRDVNNGVP
jgi:protein-S-isoprenylcysteine O-methyltransferase Ste14